MQFVRPQPYTEAVSKLGGRTVIGANLTSSEWRDVPTALRERAFFSAEIESVRFLQRAKDALGDFLTGSRETLPNGQTALKIGSRAEFVRQMREFAQAEGLGPLRPQDAGTLKDIRTEKRLGLIFDVQTTAANEFGNWKQGQDPDVLDEFPAQRFIREADVVVKRPLHWQNEGEVRLKSDLDFWLAMNSPNLGGFGVPWGPWGFGSGMGVEDVDREEAERLGLIRAGERARPVEADFNARLKASVQNLSPDLQAFLKDRFGDRVEIVDGEARWKPGGKAPIRPISPPPAPVLAPQPAPAPAAQPAPVQPTAPVASNLPPRERTAIALQEILERTGIANKARVNSDDIAALRRELQKANPADLATAVRKIEIQGRTTLKKSQIEEWTTEFLSYLPPQLVRELPKLTITVRSISSLGFHSPGGVVALHTKLAPERARRTLFHELMHWVHVDGPRWYRDLVREHFEARTAGENQVHLGGYARNVRGNRDRWYEAYAGRIYGFEAFPQGLEVPTRHFETFTETDEMLAERWNDPNFRETLLVVLRGIL